MSNNRSSALTLERPMLGEDTSPGPYTFRARIEGIRPLIYDAWIVGLTDKQRRDAKPAKRVWLAESGCLGVKSEAIFAALAHKDGGAAKSFPDPRPKSRQGSAQALLRSLLVVSPETADTGFELGDNGHVFTHIAVANMGATKGRKDKEFIALAPGWVVTFDLTIRLGEMFPPTLLREIVDYAGQVVGLGSIRPRFGLFQVTGWERTT